MWARIMGSQLVEIINIPKPMTINDIQYPSQSLQEHGQMKRVKHWVLYLMYMKVVV